MMEVYIDHLLAELDRFLLVAENFRIETIFIGGGTPSFLPTHLLDRLVTGIRERLGRFFEPGYEWTCEANPDSLAAEKIQILR
jgi:oxygen-independent coproporphyrinogen-3 oxidase